MAPGNRRIIKCKMKALDYIVYVFYVGYSKRKFSNEWKQAAYERLWLYQTGQEDQVRSALAWTISIPLGFGINNLLGAASRYYKALVFDYLFPFLLVEGIVIFLTFRFFSKKYGDKAIEEICKKNRSKISPTVARFIIATWGVIFCVLLIVLCFSLGRTFGSVDR